MFENMKINLILMIILFLFITNSLFSQDKKTYVHYKHSIGLGAGFSTGLGLSYRYIPKKFGFQINLAPSYQNYGKTAFVSLGFTLLRRIMESRTTNLYAYFGNHYLYDKSEHTTYNNPYYIPVTTTVINRNWITGIGCGFEVHAQKRIVWNMMAGWAQYNFFESMYPTIETAIYYRF